MLVLGFLHFQNISHPLYGITASRSECELIKSGKKPVGELGRVSGGPTTDSWMARFLPFIASAEAAPALPASSLPYALLPPDSEPVGPFGETDDSDWETCESDEASPMMATPDRVTKLHGERLTATRVHEQRWQRVTRHYRLGEFVCSLVMLGFALVFAIISVHERTFTSCTWGETSR